MVRFKNRYLTVEVNPTNVASNRPFLLSSKDFSRSILDAVQLIHGDFGVASVKSGFVASYCNEITRIAIIRARCGPHKLVASSLPFVKKIKDTDVVLRLIYLGGTLKKCYCFLLGHQKASLAKLLKYRRSEDTSQIEERVMNLDPLLAIEQKL